MMDRVRAAVPASAARREMGDDTRLIQRKRNRNVLMIGAVLIVAALAAALLVLPFRAWLNQRSELAARQEELSALEAANERIEASNERLQTPQGIEEAARNDLGYLEVGEQQLTVLPAPASGEALPPRWPYTIVGDIFAVRAEAAAAAAATEAAAAELASTVTAPVEPSPASAP
jgi:cell division protein FtsB